MLHLHQKQAELPKLHHGRLAPLAQQKPKEQEQQKKKQ
jgi:hypothetical protein